MRKVFAAAVLLAGPLHVGQAFAQSEPDASGFDPDVSVEFELAPQWTSDTPFNFEEITDSTALSLTATIEQKLAKGLSLEIEAGPSVVLDSDKDDPDNRGSSFEIGAELSLDLFGPFSYFVGAAYEAEFEDLFGADDGEKAEFSTGLDLNRKLSRWCAPGVEPDDCDKGRGYGGRVFFSRIDADDPLKDLDAVQAKANFGIPISWILRFDIEGSVARSWYKNSDPMFGYEQEKDTWGLDVGLDFAAGLRTILRMKHVNPWLRKVKIGYNYSEEYSNFPGKDDTSGSPSFSVVIGRDF